MSDEHIDIDDLSQDVAYKGHKTPHQIMEEKFYGVYNGKHKPYLESIEWDTWCKAYSPMEQAKRLLEINKKKAEVELKNHPFNKFF